MSAEEKTNGSENLPSPHAFLIVDGSRIIPIEEPVTTIGRKSDNHIVVNHEYVSRYHAEIKMDTGNYVLVDLDSTVGTSVNGERIHQAKLQPEDVISVGGVPIIFGVGKPKLTFDTPAPDVVLDEDSGPTGRVELQDADQYLDFFEIPED